MVHRRLRSRRFKAAREATLLFEPHDRIPLAAPKPTVSSRAAQPAPFRLPDILRALPPGELDAFISRLGIRIDPGKRLDVAAQVARTLVALPEIRDPARLPQAAVELMHRVAEARGSLIVASVPPALEPLSARAIMFARGERGRVELVLTPAYNVQLRTWESEDPRGIRALLAQASFETTSAIAAHYLGRPATPPIALALEPAWEVLSDPSRLRAEIDNLAPSERRVLESIEREGGEVDTEELLELEREPLRLRTASGATPSRRGVGLALERRGFLVPVHPNRHVVPTEVAAIVGAIDQEARDQRRDKLKTFILSGDHAPRRARFASDVSILALALAIASRESGVDVRPGIGTPKSLVQKLAARLGREPGAIALVIALSRAVGLWDASATSAAAPPGSLSMQELTGVLLHAWRRGGAWDEARSEPEILRLAPEARESSPSSVLRELVLESLRELEGGGWLPWSALAGYLKTDHRIPGLGRLLRRWAERAGVEPIEPMEVARRIVHESLPALGLVDLGEEDFDEDAEPPSGLDPVALEAETKLVLRLTPRGRALLGGGSPPPDGPRAKFLDTHVLRVAGATKVHAAIALASFVEIGRITEGLDLIMAPQTLARALSAGFDAEALKQRIEAVAPLPESLSRTLLQASVVVGRGTYVAASGFLWVEDANVRELLRTRRATSELFVDPSPPAGLILAPSNDLDKLVRRARTIGVEIVVEGAVMKARTQPPLKATPPPTKLTPGRGTKPT
jgi:hypothetical protein